MSSPVISAIMTVYNGEPYLREAVESILGQTFTDFEFIIVDDASTDATWQILSSYDDQRIRLLRNSENLRVSQSANRGIALAQGQYIARQDADDISLPERFVSQMAFMQEYPDIGFVGSDFCVIDKKGRHLHSVSLPSDPLTVTQTLYQWNCTCNGSIMLQQRFLAETGLYRSQFDPSEDYDLLLRIAERHGGANVPDCLYLHRFHSDSLSVTRLTRQASRARLARHLSQARRSAGCEDVDIATSEAHELDDLFPAEPRAVAMEHLRYAYLSYLAEDKEVARRQFESAFQADASLIADAVTLRSCLLGHSHLVADRLRSRQAGLDFVETLLPSKQYPDGSLASLRRSVEAEIHVAAAFENHALHNPMAVRQHLAAAIRLDPGWLRNRGVLSIGWQSLYRRSCGSYGPTVGKS